VLRGLTQMWKQREFYGERIIVVHFWGAMLDLWGAMLDPWGAMLTLGASGCYV